MPLTWHWLHVSGTCAPVSGNLVVVLWSNVAPVHCVVVWQAAQSCGKPAATWLGLVVFW